MRFFIFLLLVTPALAEPSANGSKPVARVACFDKNAIVWYDTRTAVTNDEMKRFLAAQSGVAIKPCSCVDAYRQCELSGRPDCVVDFMACRY